MCTGTAGIGLLDLKGLNEKQPLSNTGILSSQSIQTIDPRPDGSAPWTRSPASMRDHHPAAADGLNSKTVVTSGGRIWH